MWRLDLEKVLLVPTGEAPHKLISDDPGRDIRLAMARLALAEDDRFEVSTVEVGREGPSYTYETLELLAEENGDTPLVFVMGADAACGLETWREPRRVVELAELAIARRAGTDDAEVAAVLRSIGAGERSTMLEMPQFGISSSTARERAAAGQPLRYIVPDQVARFINERGVYG
jgi:nicotinate-nucleotide adenylyltransferase